MGQTLSPEQTPGAWEVRTISDRVVIAGGGVAGLATGLGLARTGRSVVVVDRDPLTAAADPDEAFRVQRRGAPQVRHTHGLLARLTSTLRDRFPDVLDELVGAGGVEVDLTHRFGDRVEGDEDLRVLLARRTTLEWALRRAAATQPGLTLMGEAAVAGLLADGHRVHGVRLETGEEITAGITVAAGGRRSGVPGWLAELGVALVEEQHETGIVYLTRWYRSRDEWDRVMGGDDLVKLGGDLGYLFYLAVPADRGAFSLTMAVMANDGDLRARLMEEGAFERAARALPLPSGLLDRLVPDGPVHPMGSLVNRIRRFLGPAGDPLVSGFHAVGDAHTCTNPIYGRGCSLALVQAVALTDAVAAHPDDPVARAQAYEEACGRQTEPWYHVSVHTDRGRRARAASGGAGSEAGASPIEQFFQLGGDDPLLGRAILRAVNVLATPEELINDPQVMTRVMELAAARSDDGATGPDGPHNQWARSGPSHDEMLQLAAPPPAA